MRQLNPTGGFAAFQAGLRLGRVTGASFRNFDSGNTFCHTQNLELSMLPQNESVQKIELRMVLPGWDTQNLESRMVYPATAKGMLPKNLNCVWFEPYAIQDSGSEPPWQAYAIQVSGSEPAFTSGHMNLPGPPCTSYSSSGSTSGSGLKSDRQI